MLVSICGVGSIIGSSFFWILLGKEKVTGDENIESLLSVVYSIFVFVVST